MPISIDVAQRQIAALLPGDRWMRLTIAGAEVNKPSYQAAPITSANYSTAGGVLTFDSGELVFVNTADGRVTEDWGVVDGWEIWTAETGGKREIWGPIRNAAGSVSSIDVKQGGTVTLLANQTLTVPTS